MKETIRRIIDFLEIVYRRDWIDGSRIKPKTAWKVALIWTPKSGQGSGVLK